MLSREGEPTKARVERLVAKGEMPQEAVSEAEDLWYQTLHAGVVMPNGETARVTLNDLYHIIVDSRIWRRPDRIERLLRGVFEIHEADFGRRRALSRWQEDERELFGYAILELDGGVRTMHVITERELRRQQRKGERLWPQ